MTLKHVSAMESDMFFMGDVTNFNHLSNLPKLLNTDGNLSFHVFYAGGLKVILKFFFFCKAAIRYFEK